MATVPCGDSPSESAPTDIRINATLSAVLSSSAFQRAPILSRLLIYLWEHRTEAPGEYAIAFDALGKHADFDPKLDATVRVHVARLRQKLKEYFEAEGRDLPIELVVPVGTHRLEVHEARADLNKGKDAEAAIGGSRWGPVLVAVAFLCVTVSAIALFLWRDNRRLRQDMGRLPSVSELPPFWRRAVGNGKITRMVFPTPLFFRFGELSVRDATINDPASFAQSPKLLDIARGIQHPPLSQSYSVTSDTLAVAILTRLLANGGVPLTIEATQDLSLELFGSDNLLLLGMPHTSQHVDNLLSRTEFYLRPRGQSVCIRHPKPGEPDRFLDSPGTRFGIVAVLPGQGPGTRLVLLSGRYSAALASFLASPITLRQLEEYLLRRGQPEFFEMVVATEGDGSKVQKGYPVAFRVIPANLWKQSVTPP